jgi:hypothetical protein
MIKKGHELTAIDAATPSGWRRSSHCETGTCVEIRFAGDQVLVRDGKDPRGPALSFPRVAFANFIVAAKAGAYDGS